MMPLQQIVVSPVVGGRRKSSKEVKDSQMVSGLEPAKVNSLILVDLNGY